MVDVKDQEAARSAVMEAEREIQKIKGMLTQLGSSNQTQNSLEVVLLKVEGLAENAKPILSLQLSSPVEESTLSAVFDPLNTDPAPEGSVSTFEGVETSVATLTVTAKDADIPLGTSAPHDLAPLCAIDPMDVKEKYVSELPVAIVPNNDNEPTAEATAIATDQESSNNNDNQTKSDDTEKGGEEELEETKAEGTTTDDVTSTTTTAAAAAETTEEKAKTEETTLADKKVEEVTATVNAVPLQPICTLTLRITYKPSPKDQREELYELLNKVSKKKAAALENLRQVSMSLARSGGSSSGGGGANNQQVATKSPAVKSGFLNKKKKEPSRMERLYERFLGPQSFLMRGYGVVMFTRNYIIFFGAVAFFHFKGQMLALPPPA